jgi:hypothetical protein
MLLKYYLPGSLVNLCQKLTDDPLHLQVIQKVATFDLSDGQDGKGGVDVESLFNVLSRTPRPTVIRKYVMRMKRRTEPSP